MLEMSVSRQTVALGICRPKEMLKQIATLGLDHPEQPSNVTFACITVFTIFFGRRISNPTESERSAFIRSIIRETQAFFHHLFTRVIHTIVHPFIQSILFHLVDASKCVCVCDRLRYRVGVRLDLFCTSYALAARKCGIVELRPTLRFGMCCFA